jgi:hypothetical protein
MRALRRFGAPLSDVSEVDFSAEGIVFQIGNSPRRIDIVTRISGVDFEQAYANKQEISIEGLQVPVISPEAHKQEGVVYRWCGPAFAADTRTMAAGAAREKFV